LLIDELVNIWRDYVVVTRRIRNRNDIFENGNDENENLFLVYEKLKTEKQERCQTHPN
jgi:hypothetical protein